MLISEETINPHNQGNRHVIICLEGLSTYLRIKNVYPVIYLWTNIRNVLHCMILY